MALPTEGPLSINQIRNELGAPYGSLRDLSDLAGFTPPDAMSEFYGYSPVTAVNLAARITGTRISTYDFRFNFLNNGASGDYSGLTQLYVNLTYRAYDFDVGFTRNLVHEFVVDITDFEASSSTFRAPLAGPPDKYFYNIVSINNWATSSSETLNITSVTI